MSTILPNIDDLQSVPDINFFYAKSVLELVIRKLLELDEIEVGIHRDELGRYGSVMAFAADEIDRVMVRLECFPGEYILTLQDNSENMDTSVFTYRISDHEELVESIPFGLREFMEDVADGGEPKTLRPNSLID